MFLHEADADPFAVELTHDGPVMRAKDGEFLFRHAAVGLVWHGDLAGGDRPLLVAVLVEVAVALLVTVSRYSSTASTPLEVCIQPVRALKPW